MKSPLTLRRCVSCEALHINESQRKQVEIAIENSVPLNFKSKIRSLETLGLTRKSIAEQSKLGIRKLEKILKNEVIIDEKGLLEAFKIYEQKRKAEEKGFSLISIFLLCAL